jgi:hypothetical protein
MASQVGLIRENERELVFAYRYHVVAWLGVIIGGGTVYLCWNNTLGSAPSFLRWGVEVWGLLMALCGIAGSLDSDRLTLDLLARTYTRRKGYWPRLTTQDGSFDNIQGIALQVEYQNSSHNQPIAYWVLRLVLHNPPDSISIASFGNEQAAYARLNSLAKALRVAAIDRTGDQETSTPPESLDQPLLTKLRPASNRPGQSANAVPPLPSASRILLAGPAPQRTIILPPLGFNLGAALVFGFFAMISLGMGFSALRDKLDGRHPLTPWGLIAITFLMGAFFLSLIPLISFSRRVVRETAANLSFGHQFFGWPFRFKPIAKTAIEEILVKPAPTLGTYQQQRPDLSKGFPQPLPSKHEVCIRSGADVIRIGGNLSREEQDWLRQTLLAMVCDA